MTIKASFNHLRKILFLVAALSAIGLSLAGCAGSDSGRLEKSNEVNQFFLSRQIYPDHQYYFSPPRNNPTAIIAIHKDFVLTSRIWNSVDITPEMINRWVRNMTSNRPTTLKGIWGKRIVGPNGENIGFWFSPIRRLNKGIRLVGNEVTIPAPRRTPTPSQ